MKRNNIYYKAVFRDIRKYFVEQMNISTSYVELKKQNKYKAFKPSLLDLVSKVCEGQDEPIKSELDSKEILQAVAPFLNYSEYMISFTDKDEQQAQDI